MFPDMIHQNASLMLFKKDFHVIQFKIILNILQYIWSYFKTFLSQSEKNICKLYKMIKVIKM